MKKIEHTAIELERSGLINIKSALEERLLNIKLRIEAIDKEMEQDG